MEEGEREYGHLAEVVADTRLFSRQEHDQVRALPCEYSLLIYLVVVNFKECTRVGAYLYRTSY